MKYDLEVRTLTFAKKVITWSGSALVNLPNKELLPQLIRSSTSIGANYREANDALGKKDFKYRLRIARKEAKETIYWLELILEVNPDKTSLQELLRECIEIKNILSSIINKLTS